MNPIAVLLLLLILPADALSASPKTPGGCFDFSQKITEPLRDPIPLTEGKDHGQSGRFKENGIAWGAARAVLEMPITDVYSALLDHRNKKDMDKTELQVTPQDRAGYTHFHEVHVRLKILAFIKISWSEEWGYALSEGTPKHPKKIVISYQKKSGTQHLKHLCGSVVLQKIGEKKTDIFLYEQIKATRRSAEDTLRMHLGLLETIRATRD